MGFWVFPLIEGGKTPAVKDWPHRATRDPAAIRAMWGSRPHNIGVFTERYGDDLALLVVDIDVKNGAPGDASLLAFVREHRIGVPWVVDTPTGGRHLYYTAKTAARSRTGVLPGIDIRSRGGYVVGPGSVTATGRYAWRTLNWD